jgi:hypothetical protein
MSGEKRNWLGGLVQNIPMSWVLRHCEGAARQGVSIEAVLRDSLIEPSYGDDRDEVSFDQFGLLMLNTARWLEDDSSGLGQRPIPIGIEHLGRPCRLGVFDIGIRDRRGGAALSVHRHSFWCRGRW